MSLIGSESVLDVLVNMVQNLRGRSAGTVARGKEY